MITGAILNSTIINLNDFKYNSEFKDNRIEWLRVQFRVQRLSNWIVMGSILNSTMIELNDYGCNSEYNDNQLKWFQD